MDGTMTAIKAEHAMDEILRDIHKTTDSNFIAVKNWLCVLMYTTKLYENDAVELFKQFCTTGTLPALNQYL